MSSSLTKKTENDLLKELKAKRDELRKFRFDMTGSKIKNVRNGRAVRKDVARILTALNERQRNV
ncbi:MAG: 50S ribosomal protein L29 [bacterium]|nr:50S ribosomal protein L29 [bacterium]